MLFDLYYFCQKLLIEKKIKVDKIELCIITTYNAFEENQKQTKEEKKYNNFKDMKKYCEEHKFEFIIFNTNTSQYFHYNNNKLEKINLNYDEFQYDFKKIFNNDKYFGISKKINYYYNKKTKIIGKIKFTENTNFDKIKVNDNFNFKKDFNAKTIIFYDDKDNSNMSLE